MSTPPTAPPAAPPAAPRTLLPTATRRQAAATLWQLAKPRLPVTLLAVAFLVAGSVVALLGPFLLGRIVDLVVEGASHRRIATVAGGLLLVAIGQSVFTALGGVLTARAGEGMLAELRETVVARALNLPIATVEEAGSGDLAARIGGDVSVMANAIRNILPEFSIAFLNVSLTVGGLALLDWRFALAGLCAVPIQIASLLLFLRRSAPIYARQRTAESARAQAILDAIRGAPTARAFNLAERQAGRVADTSAQTTLLEVEAVNVQTAFSARLNSAELTGMAAILIAGFFLVRDGHVTIGATTAAALYFHRLFDPIGVVLGAFDEVLKAASGLARLAGVARMEAFGSGERPRSAVADVRLSGVRFSYVPGHEVLGGVDLEIRDGEHVALVGTSGAGKTTIARLVAGLQAPDTGDVLVGGQPVPGPQSSVVSRDVVLVTQEVHVFAGTIAQDLRLANPAVNEAALWEALERMGAAGWVRNLPQGLETVVGDGGHKLTPAQAQQLTLTRLVLADPKLAILDEATAEAGSAGARMLEASARAALAGRTGLVVAHRLSQAATADRIIDLEHGRVVEHGSHEELLAANGAYAAQWAASAAHRPGLGEGRPPAP